MKRIESESFQALIIYFLKAYTLQNLLSIQSYLSYSAYDLTTNIWSFTFAFVPFRNEYWLFHIDFLQVIGTNTAGRGVLTLSLSECSTCLAVIGPIWEEIFP